MRDRALVLLVLAFACCGIPEVELDHLHWSSGPLSSEQWTAFIGAVDHLHRSSGPLASEQWTALIGAVDHLCIGAVDHLHRSSGPLASEEWTAFIGAVDHLRGPQALAKTYYVQLF